MKAKLSIFLLILFFGSIFSSCKKDGDTSVSLDSIGDLLDIDSLILENTIIDQSNYESGVIVRFQHDGTISSLGVKMPDNDEYQITLWDMVDTSIVETVTIKPKTDKPKFKSITPVEVNTNDLYAITVFSNDYYLYEYENGQDIFPIDLDDVTIEGYGFKFFGSNPKGYNKNDFPDDFRNDYYVGIYDIKFDRDTP